MTIEEILKYVMYTPENINPNILRSMLSQIEGGGSSDGQIMILTQSFDDDTVILDKTWQEIYDAFNEDIIMYIPIKDHFRLFVTHVEQDENIYGVRIGDYLYTAASPSDYPTTLSDLPK